MELLDLDLPTPCFPNLLVLSNCLLVSGSSEGAGKFAELSLDSKVPSIDLILEAQLEMLGEMESGDVGEAS